MYDIFVFIFIFLYIDRNLIFLDVWFLSNRAYFTYVIREVMASRWVLGVLKAPT